MQYCSKGWASRVTAPETEAMGCKRASILLVNKNYSYYYRLEGVAMYVGLGLDAISLLRHSCDIYMIVIDFS